MEFTAVGLKDASTRLTPISFIYQANLSGGRRRSSTHLEPGIRLATPFTSAALDASAAALV
jgi:hypothetical protein